MKKYFDIIRKCTLFEGIGEPDLGAMLSCLGGRIMETGKNQVIFAEGDPATHVGIVLAGSAQILRTDYYGNRSIVARLEPGELFGESFACAGVATLPVSVAAEEPGAVLLIDCRRITVSCTNACEFHSRMIFNLLKVVATKNLVFDRKMEITSKRTTREKLMAYLLGQAKLRGASSFTIPYDRQALADYLEVDRSAMSAEISKLRRDGIIECEKSRFRIL